MLDDIDARADQTYKEVVALRNKVERIRAKVVSMLYIVLKAIQNQGGVRDGGPSSK